MDYQEKVEGLRIVDLVNSYPTSVRLRNCINKARETDTLPFETVGDYLKAISTAQEQLLKISNLGRKTVDELIHLIDTTIKKNLLEKPPKHEKREDLLEMLSERYPGVFDPLIEEYLATSEDNVLKLEKLEIILLDLCDKKSQHAELAWFRFAGETLEEIGKSYGLT